jgi:hypothetical protein
MSVEPVYKKSRMEYAMESVGCEQFLKIEDMARKKILEAFWTEFPMKALPLIGRISKPSKEEAVSPDKIIFFDSYGSNHSLSEKIVEENAKRWRDIPRFYITAFTSREPLKTLTVRTQLFYFEKGGFVLQSTNDLVSRGWRVVQSFPQKGLSSKKRKTL